ncbi:PD-(D/E)XK nuclease family transposase [Treponema sp. OMZ 792]|uniref:Rpn family recombination-promoting nuclease/putative transposase n=1 Tax=unclassified Treponema TaxID=2638727 RepID=UPI0020A535E6|nr:MULTISPECIES: Rpn family recombination-promoting nuclease/putative transposase [unclassified Treponema]UTC62293.1 PD-(D/E)XK nuclease family transposase [Treponema sp. OMZ 787]UTC76382.1 PD-(D/E)XK nuclease family transposase [Treponema sp. OMZ 792]UTC79142.1 PD-(D/E)XK nuclease family transposase [Treponema sp. OMZ 799]UTC81555.1 PD-(D/E)XK nuclease family transposase [Treponema sp. OMZ 798]
MEKLFKITLRNDYAFKRVFGVEENKDILQDFLECILDIPPETIAGLELLDKEFHRDSITDKTGVLDVKLRLKNNTIIDIEIQNRWNSEFAQRTIFYWAKMYTENLKTGEVYTKLPKCITINIVGEGFNLNNLIHSEYNVVEKHLNDKLSDELEIHFLNLAKIEEQENIEQDEKKKKLYNWLKFIETDDREVRNMLAQESPMMAKANTTIEIMEMSPKEKWLYENRMKYEHDKASWKHVGYQEGIEQGAYQKALETAAAFKKLGIDIDKIAQGTGLSIQEIQAL